MKKTEYNNDEWKVICRILVVIILVMAFLWYRSDNGRIKRIEELKTQIEEYESGSR